MHSITSLVSKQQAGICMVCKTSSQIFPPLIFPRECEAPRSPLAFAYILFAPIAPTCLVFPPLPCSLIDYSIVQYQILSSIFYILWKLLFSPSDLPFVFLSFYQLIAAVIPQLYWSITTLPNLKLSMATITCYEIIDRVGEQCQRNHPKIFYIWSFTENIWSFCFIFRSTTS